MEWLNKVNEKVIGTLDVCTIFGCLSVNPDYGGCTFHACLKCFLKSG